MISFQNLETMKTTDFSEYISEYLKDFLLNEKGLSENTIRSYRDSFFLLLTFLEEKKKHSIHRLYVKDITKKKVIEFLDWLQFERKCSVTTRNLRLSAIQSFFKFLSLKELSHLKEIQKIISIKKKKSNQPSFKYLTIEETKILLAQPKASTRRGIRDLALLSTLYYSGARVQEIIDLTPSMLRLKKPQTIRLKGKGGKRRIVPLSENVVSYLSKYIKIEGLDLEDNKKYPVFFNSRKEKLTRAGVNYILKKYIKMANINNEEQLPTDISCHTLRHSQAMHLLQAGVNIVYIRDILGHASVVTTEIYARADSKHKRLALEKAYENIQMKVDDPIWENNSSLKSWLKRF